MDNNSPQRWNCEEAGKQMQLQAAFTEMPACVWWIHLMKSCMATPSPLSAFDNSPNVMRDRKDVLGMNLFPQMAFLRGDARGIYLSATD